MKALWMGVAVRGKVDSSVGSHYVDRPFGSQLFTGRSLTVPTSLWNQVGVTVRHVEETILNIANKASSGQLRCEPCPPNLGSEPLIDTLTLPWPFLLQSHGWCTSEDLRSSGTRGPFELRGAL